MPPIIRSMRAAFRDHPYGRSPLNQPQLQRLGELLGLNLLDRKQIGVVDFTRPELSPCLAQRTARNGLRYREALSIIRAGQEQLATRRRPDMPGFRLVAPVEIEQEKKYQSRLRKRPACGRRSLAERNSSRRRNRHVPQIDRRGSADDAGTDAGRRTERGRKARSSVPVADYGQGKVFVVSAEGKIEWSYAVAQTRRTCGCCPTAIFFSVTCGRIEITRDKNIVWQYKTDNANEIHTCQPLPDGRVLIGECGAPGWSKSIARGRSAKNSRSRPPPRAPTCRCGSSAKRSPARTSCR